MKTELTLADLDTLPLVIELADLPKWVGISAQQIRNLMKRRRFPIEPLRRVDRRVRFSGAAVRRYLEQRD
jgi:predicted DNA-binding transcriptional regulator AlpA